MSQRYTVGCSTSVPHTCVFLSPCSVPWSSTPSSAPAKFPSPTQFSFPHPCQTLLVCRYFLPDTHSSPFAPIPVLPPPGETSCFLLPKNGILFSVCLSSCPFFGSPVRILSTSSVVPFPVLRVELCHPQISNLPFFHLRCQPLRLIHPVPLPFP